MQSFKRGLLWLAVGMLSVASLRAQSRQQWSVDLGWHFLLGDPAGAESAALSDASWRTVNLPHDWSIEGKIDKESLSGQGGGYLPGGIGWYRKSFLAPAAWQGKRLSVEFDGVYRNASIYLNGQKLGLHRYGYTSFAYDLTPALKYGSTNLLAVRVDDSELPNTRWYSGAGIYRRVRFVLTEPVHVGHWGVFVATRAATANAASLAVATTVANDSAAAVEATLRTVIFDSDGREAARAEMPVKLAAGASDELQQKIAVANPALWYPEQPKLYRARTQVMVAGKVVDEQETRFGIRTLAWSPEKGLLLNGQSIKLNGGSVHHDNGPLGAAAFDRAEERRVETLKAAGFNAVRTAHNPPSPAFLDACDRLGLLVLDEPFDVWKTGKVKFDYSTIFDAEWQGDLDAMLLRDRNHPSIILWGIGNEIPDVFTGAGTPIAEKLIARVRHFDTTRPITQAFPGATYGAKIDSVMNQLDISGYNYNIQINGDKDHERVPGRMMVTTESMPASVYELWKLHHAHPYTLGEFVWTSIDYLGESGIGVAHYLPAEQADKMGQMVGMMNQMLSSMGADGKNPFEGFANAAPKKDDPAAASMAIMMGGYPWHAANCGDIDLTGYRKPQSYYRDIVWNGGNRLYTTVHLPAPAGQKEVAVAWSVPQTLPSWSWPGQEGKPLAVDVYTDAETVQLLLNGKLIDEKPVAEAKAVFDVPYAPGELKAVALRNGHEVASQILATTGKAASLRLSADRTALAADGEDLAFVTVEALDASGRLDPNAAEFVDLEASGAATIAAVGNGDGTDETPYTGHRLHLFHGRGLVVVRTTAAAGSIELKAEAQALGKATVSMSSHRPAAVTELP